MNENDALYVAQADAAVYFVTGRTGHRVRRPAPRRRGASSPPRARTRSARPRAIQATSRPPAPAAATSPAAPVAPLLPHSARPAGAVAFGRLRQVAPCVVAVMGCSNRSVLGGRSCRAATAWEGTPACERPTFPQVVLTPAAQAVVVGAAGRGVSAGAARSRGRSAPTWGSCSAAGLDCDVAPLACFADARAAAHSSASRRANDEACRDSCVRSEAGLRGTRRSLPGARAGTSWGGCGALSSILRGDSAAPKCRALRLRARPPRMTRCERVLHFKKDVPART